MVGWERRVPVVVRRSPVPGDPSTTGTNFSSYTYRVKFYKLETGTILTDRGNRGRPIFCVTPSFTTHTSSRDRLTVGPRPPTVSVVGTTSRGVTLARGWQGMSSEEGNTLRTVGSSQGERVCCPFTVSSLDSPILRRVGTSTSMAPPTSRRLGPKRSPCTGGTGPSGDYRR